MPFFCCVASPNRMPQKMGPLRFAHMSSSSVTLEWSNRQGSSVEVRCREKGSVWMTVDPNTNQLVPLGKGKGANSKSGSLIVGGLKELVAYEFTCCAVSHTGSAGPYSDPVSFKTPTRAVPLPEVVVEELTPHSATLTWEAESTTPLFVKIRRKGETVWQTLEKDSSIPADIGPTNDAATFPNGKTLVEGLTPETSYEFTLQADSVRSGAMGDVVSFSTSPASNGPEMPIVLRCGSVSRNSITLEWDGSAADSFWNVSIRGKKKGSSDWLQVDAVKSRLVTERDAWAPAASQRSIQLKKLDEGQAYTFSARGLTKKGEYTPWSEAVVNTTQVVMQPLKIGKVTPSTVHFEWNVPECAVNVAIRCRKVNTDKWFHVDSRTNLLVSLGKGIAPRASECAIILRGLQEKTTYETAACVRTSSGWGPYSQRSVFETPAAQVVVVQCTKVTDTALTLKLNMPASRDCKVALKIKQETDAFWSEIDADAGKIVASGEGTQLAHGVVQVDGLKKNAMYKIETSKETGQAPLIVNLGRPLLSTEVPATTCAQFRRCRSALISKLSERPILLDHLLESMDRCFCAGCHTDGGVYKRGGTDYILPVGWSRIGVRTSKTPAMEQLAFKTWHTCYHGTSPEHLFDILCCGQLLKPGSTTPKGGKIPIRDGHIQRGFKRTNSHNGKNEFFDPPSHIFFSPSIKYCDYGRAYMTEHAYNGKRYRFALQVKIQPDTYSVGQETVGAKRRGDTIDPNVSNNSIEWYTSELHTHMITGILVNER